MKTKTILFIARRLMITISIVLLLILSLPESLGLMKTDLIIICLVFSYMKINNKIYTMDTKASSTDKHFLYHDLPALIGSLLMIYTLITFFYLIYIKAPLIDWLFPACLMALGISIFYYSTEAMKANYGYSHPKHWTMIMAETANTIIALIAIGSYIYPLTEGTDYAYLLIYGIIFISYMVIGEALVSHSNKTIYFILMAISILIVTMMFACCTYYYLWPSNNATDWLNYLADGPMLISAIILAIAIAIPATSATASIKRRNTYA